MYTSERGMADKVTIIIGLAFCLLLIGFFRPDGAMNKINFKAMMMLPCGLTENTLSLNDKITFPIQVSGYINGCGWERDGMNAGMAQVFDAKGFPVTAPVPMDISDSGTQLPLPFVATLRANFAPQTDNGQLVLKSTTGLVKMIPVTF